MKYKDIGLDELLNGLEDDIGDCPTPSMYQYSTGLKNRKIIINDNITSDILEKVIIPLIDMDNDGSGKPIEIILNTLGGEVYTGFALVDAIENLKSPTVIRIVGTALSMGIYLAMAGHNNPNVTTVCNKYSVGLIHAGTVGYGIMDSNAAKDVSKFNERYEETIVKDFVFTHSNITPEKYEEIERREYYMTANEMLELGIVDKIL